MSQRAWWVEWSATQQGRPRDCLLIENSPLPASRGKAERWRKKKVSTKATASPGRRHRGGADQPGLGTSDRLKQRKRWVSDPPPKCLATMLMAGLAAAEQSLSLSSRVGSRLPVVCLHRRDNNATDISTFRSGWLDQGNRYEPRSQMKATCGKRLAACVAARREWCPDCAGTDPLPSPVASNLSDVMKEKPLEMRPEKNRKTCDSGLLDASSLVIASEIF
ncbi:hypothetical protein MMC26_004222 [Xylographa opegraphella]|nr:hypothetical protein [Xylographa opegraphella]